MLDFQFLRTGPARLVSLILVAEILLFYSAPTTEHIPHPPPLDSFQRDVGTWRMVRQMQIDPESEALLKADDTLNRIYLGASGPLTLYIGFFKSQRGGVTPHSPKICLPGAGWTPEESHIISIGVPGENRPIPVNRYIVRHGEERSLVLYWYSTAHNVVADEYVSKLYLMYEGLRYRRSDEAVYRVIVPILGSEKAAEDQGIRFIQAVYQPLKQQMWST
jgi:EpsI family protein